MHSNFRVWKKLPVDSFLLLEMRYKSDTELHSRGKKSRKSFSIPQLPPRPHPFPSALKFPKLWPAFHLHGVAFPRYPHPVQDSVITCLLIDNFEKQRQTCARMCTVCSSIFTGKIFLRGI